MHIKPLGSNQTLLITNHGYEILYSYETAVAGYNPTLGLHFRTTKRYSNTTTKHINKYLAGRNAIALSPEDIEQMGTNIS